MHNHHCPFHNGDFSCDSPFCEGVNPMACDECFSDPAQIVQLDEKLRRVAEYARERDKTPVDTAWEVFSTEAA